MPRTRDRDRMLAAALYGQARRLAVDAGSIADARQIIEEMADGRQDLIAQEAGRAAGAWSVSAGRSHPVELLAAGLLVVSGPLDLALVQRWVREGQRRGAAPMHGTPACGNGLPRR